jgi:hypothetical protein
MATEVSVLAAAPGDGPGPILTSDVTFLPRAEDDGAGAYPGEVPALIRELESAGVSARTWHDGQHVEFLDERGPIAEMLLEFGIGIASSGGWSALQALLRRRPEAQVKLTIVVDRDGHRSRVEASGDADGVAAALAGLDLYGPPRP